MSWKKLRIILPIVGTIAIVWFLLSRFDFLELRGVLIASDYSLMFFALLSLIVAHPIMALRWKMALSLAGHTISFREAFTAYLANLPITKLTPTYSGDFLRALYFKDKVPASIGAGVILLETLVDICVLVFTAGLGAFWMGAYLSGALAALIFFGIILFCILVHTAWVRSRTMKYPKVQNFLQALSLVRSQPSQILFLALLSLTAWILVVIFFYLAFRAVGASVPITAIIALQSIATFAALLPITVSGVGIRESGMLILYAQLASATDILSVGLAYSFLSVVFLPILCLPLTIRAIRKSTHKVT